MSKLSGDPCKKIKRKHEGENEGVGKQESKANLIMTLFPSQLLLRFKGFIYSPPRFKPLFGSTISTPAAKTRRKQLI